MHQVHLLISGTLYLRTAHWTSKIWRKKIAFSCNVLTPSSIITSVRSYFLRSLPPTIPPSTHLPPPPAPTPASLLYHTNLHDQSLSCIWLEIISACRLFDKWWCMCLMNHFCLLACRHCSSQLNQSDHYCTWLNSPPLQLYISIT